MTTEKQEEMPVKKVAISPSDWEKIVRYLFDMPVSFGNADKAAEIKSIIENVLWLDVKIDKGKDEQS